MSKASSRLVTEHMQIVLNVMHLPISKQSYVCRELDRGWVV